MPRADRRAGKSQPVVQALRRPSPGVCVCLLFLPRGFWAAPLLAAEIPQNHHLGQVEKSFALEEAEAILPQLAQEEAQPGAGSRGPAVLMSMQDEVSADGEIA